MRYLTMIKDVDGLPRAWGSADTEEASRAVAEQQWARRIAERTAAGTLDRSEERGETETKPIPDLETALRVTAERLDVAFAEADADVDAVLDETSIVAVLALARERAAATVTITMSATEACAVLDALEVAHEGFDLEDQDKADLIGAVSERIAGELPEGVRYHGVTVTREEG